MMSSEFLEDMDDHEGYNNLDSSNVEEQLDRSLDDPTAFSEPWDLHVSDDWEMPPGESDDLLMDALDDASQRSGTPTFQFQAPTAKSAPKRKSGVFVDVGGQPFQSRTLGGTTDFIVFDETLKASRTEIKTPWDCFWKGTSSSSSFNSPALPSLGRLEANLSLVTIESERATRPSVLACRRLKAARLAMSDDHLFDLALRKLREIILFCPEDSGAGRTMLDTAGRLVPQNEILQILSDCLGKKAVSTIAKHVSVYHKFSRWVVAHGAGRPMSPKEADVYAYLKFLERENSGPTAGTAFVKSIGFFDGCFRYIETPAAIFLSTRSLGAARVMAKEKRPLRQAPPLTTDHVYLLEKCVANSEVGSVQVAFGGFVLFCLFASGRFTDAARIRELSLERCEDVSLLKSLAYDYL